MKNYMVVLQLKSCIPFRSLNLPMLSGKQNKVEETDEMKKLLKKKVDIKDFF